MSVEAPKVEEVAPVESKVAEQASSETPVVTDAPVAQGKATEETTAPADAAPATDGVKKDETVAEVKPASEGVLGYKGPGLLKQFYFSKHYFWFSEEPTAPEHLTGYLRNEKSHTVGHEHAAWARETGKGALFFAKRAEDKPHPSGIFLLHEVSDVVKEGSDAFAFKSGAHTYKFEAANSKERDSWVVAIQKGIEDASGLKEDIVGRESYKKTLEDYAKTPTQIIAAATSRSKSKEVKSADSAAVVPSTVEPKPEESPAVESAPAEDKKVTQKERSQSRKRSSIFGAILGKKDEKEAQHDAKKEIKAEEKAEKKAEKDAIKEHKKEEALVKKDEAEVNHDTAKATDAAKDAAEAAAVAAVPAAAVVAAEKHEDKKEEKDANGATTPEKKTKRGSVFGGLFKKGASHPAAEKNEKEVAPVVPVKDEVPPVSETAPKLDEPIENKPINTAEVTAPADSAPQHPVGEEPAKEAGITPVTEEHKHDKKGGFLAGFIKKAEGKKEEPKETKVVEPAAAPEAQTPAAVVDAVDGPSEAPVTKEERPAREKRKSSLFGGLSTLKRKDGKKETTEAGEESPVTETKREKSPLPARIGGLFRKPSKAVKSESEGAQAGEKNSESPVTSEATPATAEVPVSASDVPSTNGPEIGDSKIVGDVVPETLHAKVDSPISTVPEVKASA